jgi:sensor c-di-GMP phosphodiesterase-like protein
VLKIDKSFIDDISNLQNDREIAATIIDGAYSGFKLLTGAFVTLL